MDSRRKTQDSRQRVSLCPVSCVLCPRGFTLVELLVVMAIVGLLIATSVPALSRYASQVRLRAATREVIGLLSLARSSAIGSRQPRTITLNTSQRSLFILETAQTEPRIVRWPSSMTVEATAHDEPVQALVFKPTGGLEGGRAVTITLSQGTKSQTVTIASTTGSLSVN